MLNTIYIFLIISLLCGIIFILWFHAQIRKTNPQRFYVDHPSGQSRLDFKLVRDVFIKSSQLVGYVFIFLNIINYVFTERWLFSYSYELSRLVLFIGAILSIGYIIEGLYDFTKDKGVEKTAFRRKSSNTIPNSTKKKDAKPDEP